jgi:hypothetical protein
MVNKTVPSRWLWSLKKMVLHEPTNHMSSIEINIRHGREKVGRVKLSRGGMSLNGGKPVDWGSIAKFLKNPQRGDTP